MNREDRERLERRQRMLAREQGSAPAAAPPLPEPQRRRLRAEQTPPRSAKQNPPPENPKIKSISVQLQRRQRRRTTLMIAAVLVIAAVLAVASGLFSTSIAMLGDLTDSIVLSFNRAGGGYPASTGIRTPLQVEELAGGFVELDSGDRKSTRLNSSHRL